MLSSLSKVVLLCDQDVTEVPCATGTNDHRHNSNKDFPLSRITLV